MKALPKSKTPYYSILKHRVASNGINAFHKGQLMPKANPNNLHTKSIHRDSDIILSFKYFGDGEYVYYKNKLLPTTDNNQAYSVEVYSRKNEDYLYNPLDGMAYVNDISFDEKNSPYRVISKIGSHVNHTLWLSENGIYFYNTEKIKYSELVTTL